MKIEKEHEIQITGGIPNIIPPPISDNSNLYQPINNVDLNRIDAEEPNSTKPKTNDNTPITYTPIYTPASTYSPSVSPARSQTR
jgi:hypothetical protein